ncbi:Anaerobic dimethyl sulfoxide reductase chain C, anchor subunit [hydrothermal vent metagenome]|uniref:Anaerobic dimethyl sulfoxide reductase chain C, anchor subunit n=1 Tax=hydrothermal vent metagenome TaxID=652676 RepID=A0A3B0YA08_9ZZZZ
MNPAYSVIFLTTLIGVGQGMFLAVFTVQSYEAMNLLSFKNPTEFYGMGSLLALVFLVGGLIASIFHLGRPERAWRSAAQWRTSWLSREVIALPLVMGLIFIYGVMHYFNWDPILFVRDSGAKIQLSLIIGGAAALSTLVLYVCTGMIYACIKFLQEWASPLTVVNYTLLGLASGFTITTALAAMNAPELVSFYGIGSIIFIITAFITRTASLIRNHTLKPKSSLQTAIGVRHPKITQKAMGFMAGSMNTRDFFHHQSQLFLKNIKWIFIVLVFIVPVILLWIGIQNGSFTTLITAFGIQYLGLIAERWFFFAQANHPQNLYYQTI